MYISLIYVEYRNYTSNRDDYRLEHCFSDRLLVLVTSDQLAPHRIIPPEALTDPVTVMGAAAWFAGSAALDCGLIADDHQPARLPEKLDRYIAGEFCARLAQECLELVYAELSDYSQLPPARRTDPVHQASPASQRQYRTPAPVSAG